MAIPGQTAPFKKLLVCTYKTKSNFRKMETLPDEILLKTFSYLNILDIVLWYQKDFKEYVKISHSNTMKIIQYQVSTKEQLVIT